MNKKLAKEFFGCQIWIEPTDSDHRIDELVKEARNSGIGWLRIFLMWPWIEPNPNEWDFKVFDTVFDACEKYGILIKATLTANSGPWHIGTPSLLHSHTGFLGKNQTEAIERYIEKCVTRYKDHPALGQWILWNEPGGGADHTDETLELWQEWLKQKYNNDLVSLNKRWRTGYSDFNEIPFSNEVTHPEHRGNQWNSYRPHLDNCKFQSYWLITQLQRVKAIVKKYDDKTETCINPVPANNQASTGTDLQAMGELVDILGASYHPAWQFIFADRSLFPALMAAGVKKKASHPSVKRVEITEVQSGNTLNSSHRPCDVNPSELARFYLSGLFSGAESVTGWLLNARSYDFEAGDWGLLDDQDHQSDRSRMLRKVHDRIEVILDEAGTWTPCNSKVYIGYDFNSQAIELVDSKCGNVSGRLADDGNFGTVLLNCLFMQQGTNSVVQRLQDLPSDGSNGGLIMLSNLVSWEDDNAEQLLSFVNSGGTLVFDATCGRKDTDAVLHRPWPGGISKEICLEAVGLDSNPQGFPISLYGQDAGKWILARMTPSFADNSGWKAWEELRFTHDEQPCVWERDYGKGKIVLLNGIMGPSLVHEETSFLSLRYIISKLSKDISNPIRPLSGYHSAFSLDVSCEKGMITAIFSDSRIDRQGKYLQIKAPQGVYRDLWTGETVCVPQTGEVKVLAEDGIVLLWNGAETK